MRKLRRIGLYFLIFIAFWVITFTFEHFHPLPRADAPAAKVLSVPLAIIATYS